jgi:hypothetical protein
VTPFEGFAIAMNQFKAEGEAALLDLCGSPEAGNELVNRVLEKIKATCKDESSIAVFLACGQIVANVTRERVLREAENDAGN